jgi:hypothetical protein
MNADCCYVCVCVGIVWDCQEKCERCCHYFTPSRYSHHLCTTCNTLRRLHPADFNSTPEDAADKENAPTPDSSSSIRQKLASAILQPSRKRKEFSQLKTSQQNKRKKLVKEFARVTDTPLSALQPSAIPPIHLIHLPTSTRRQIRTIPTIKISSEKKIAAFKVLLANDFGTRTASFETEEIVGAYLTDPLKFLSLVSLHSPFICIGGDAGGGVTKLGVTYLDENKKQKFAAVFVYADTDHYDAIMKTTKPGLSPFTGDSVDCRHIFHVFQTLIEQRQTRQSLVFLNGDWVFLNVVLGLMGPSANYPCPICVVHRKRLLSIAEPRSAANRFDARQGQYTIHPGHKPLITISPDSIVPIPLHLLLGIGNKIILHYLKNLFGSARMELLLTPIKTFHTPGKGGLADLNMYGLNGPEITRFLRKLAPLDLFDDMPLDIDTTSSEILLEWLKKLHDCLLQKAEWKPNDLDDFQQLVHNMWDNWERTSTLRPFPKLHMLRHAYEFAERHKFLGLASESKIESYHHIHADKQHNHHMNLGRKEAEKQRRSLADTTLIAVQPIFRAVSNPL